MTSNAHPSSARSRRRGTRGFAAFVTAIAGFVSLAVGAVVLPATSLDTVALNWLVPLAIAFGIAHFVAVVGLVRNRRWAARLTGYLSAIGIGVAAYGLLVTVTGLDPFGATSSPAGARGSSRRPRADGLDDRPLAGRRPVRHPRRRAGRPARRSPGRDARRRLTLAARPPRLEPPTRARTTLLVRAYVICHAGDGTFAG